MPELPEVETIARGLSSRVMGDVIESVWLGSKPEPLKSPAVEIVRTLESRRITAVRRVGKHIVFDLELADGVGRAPSPARRRHKTRSLPSPKKAAGGGARPTPSKSGELGSPAQMRTSGPTWIGSRSGRGRTLSRTGPARHSSAGRYAASSRPRHFPEAVAHSPGCCCSRRTARCRDAAGT